MLSSELSINDGDFSLTCRYLSEFKSEITIGPFDGFFLKLCGLQGKELSATNIRFKANFWFANKKVIARRELCTFHSKSHCGFVCCQLSIFLCNASLLSDTSSIPIDA